MSVITDRKARKVAAPKNCVTLKGGFRLNPEEAGFMETSSSLKDMPAEYQLLHAMAHTGDIIEWEGQRIVVVKPDDLAVKDTDDTPTALLKYLGAHELNPDEPLCIPTEVYLRGYKRTRILTIYGTRWE